MGRRKVNLMRIANDAARRATFRKRRLGLMKKAQELATLCDVKACVVVYGEGSTEPEVWPSVPEATEVFERFKAMPELEQFKKRMDQEGLLRLRIAKLQEQLKKSQRENGERETTLLLHDVIVGRRGLGDLTIEEVTSLGCMVETRLKSVNDRINQLRGQDQPPAPTLAPPASSLPLMPYDGSNMDANAPALDQTPNLPDWPIDVATPGGDLGAMVYGGFSSDNDAGTSAWDDMLQSSNLDADFAWPDPGTSFPPM